MNNEYLNVNDIKEFSSLTSKQIRNKINVLKTSSSFSSLIYGGGKGKGGKLWFHYSILPYITYRQRRRFNKDIHTTLKGRKLSEYYFSKSYWNYFGCIKPNIDIDISDLVNSLNNFLSFYVVHRKNEKNHIHFILDSTVNQGEIKEELKKYYTKNDISIDKIFLTQFDFKLKNETLNYLLRKGVHSSQKDLIDWGLSIPNTNIPH